MAGSRRSASWPGRSPRRQLDLGPVDRVVIDKAHHAVAAIWRRGPGPVRRRPKDLLGMQDEGPSVMSNLHGGFMTSNVNSEPEGLPACILQAVVNDEGVEWFTLSIGLPHYQALAEAIEAEGRAAGSTRLRGLGLPTPIQAEPGIVRLWAKWRKLRDGSAILHDIEIRAGKERNGGRIVDLHHSSGGAFGSRFGMHTDRDGYPRRRARLLATCHALDAFAALPGRQRAAPAGEQPAGAGAMTAGTARSPITRDHGRTRTWPVGVPSAAGAAAALLACSVNTCSLQVIAVP
jgi:hypothetical protein